MAADDFALFLRLAAAAAFFFALQQSHLHLSPQLIFIDKQDY
jgi:hypothetical protein